MPKIATVRGWTRVDHCRQTATRGVHRIHAVQIDVHAASSRCGWCTVAHTWCPFVSCRVRIEAADGRTFGLRNITHAGPWMPRRSEESCPQADTLALSHVGRVVDQCESRGGVVLFSEGVVFAGMLP